MLLQTRLYRRLCTSIQSFQHSTQDIFKEVVQHFRSFEDLKDNLQENRTFSIVYSNIGLNGKHGLIGNLNQHSNIIGISCDLISSKNHIVVKSVHQGVSKRMLVLIKDRLHAWENFENYV